MHRNLRFFLTVALVACAPRPALGSAASRLNSTEVSIADFGAIPNDGLDDRAAIQAALSSGAASVLVPNGTYDVAKGAGYYDLVIQTAGVTLRGETRDGAVLRQLCGQGGAVRLLLVAAANVTISTLTLDGQADGVVTNPDGSTSRCQTVDEHRAGVFAMTAPGVRIEHVTSRHFTGDGFYVYNHSDNPTVTDVLATGNERDGIVFGGGTTGGVVSGSTFSGNRAQQFDTEGGVVTNLTVTGNTMDGTPHDGFAGSNDYVFTATGSGSLTRSSGWVISGNTINGGLELVWIDNTLVALNHGVNATTKPSVTLWRTTNGIAFTGNNFLDTQTAAANSAVVFIGGTGTGQATAGFVAKGNTLTATGHPSTFGYRIEGAVSAEIWDDVITGPGVASPYGAGIYLRATNAAADFQLARVVHATIRNFGAFGVEVCGAGAARLAVLELAYNTFDDTSAAATMRSAMSLDADRTHAAKDVRVVGNALSGGCATALATTPAGALSAWGDRWMAL